MRSIVSDAKNGWLIATVIAGTAVGGATFASIAWASTLTTKQAFYTSEQAARGKLVYEKSCANCHAMDFYRDRLTRFENRSIGELFDAVSATMPADNVGNLPTSNYIDVLAYIFSETGSPAGKAELTTDNANDITIVKK